MKAGPVFAEPWQAQAFALAVRLSEQGHFTWKEWAELLPPNSRRRRIEASRTTARATTNIGWRSRTTGRPQRFARIRPSCAAQGCIGPMPTATLRMASRWSCAEGLPNPTGPEASDACVHGRFLCDQLSSARHARRRPCCGPAATSRAHRATVSAGAVAARPNAAMRLFPPPRSRTNGYGGTFERWST